MVGGLAFRAVRRVHVIVGGVRCGGVVAASQARRATHGNTSHPDVVAPGRHRRLRSTVVQPPVAISPGKCSPRTRSLPAVHLCRSMHLNSRPSRSRSHRAGFPRDRLPMVRFLPKASDPRWIGTQYDSDATSSRRAVRPRGLDVVVGSVRSGGRFRRQRGASPATFRRWHVPAGPVAGRGCELGGVAPAVHHGGRFGPAPERSRFGSQGSTNLRRERRRCTRGSA